MEESQCFTLGYGERTKTEQGNACRRFSSRDFRLLHSVSSLEKRRTQRGGEGLTEWQARKPKMAEEVGAAGQGLQESRPAPPEETSASCPCGPPSDGTGSIRARLPSKELKLRQKWNERKIKGENHKHSQQTKQSSICPDGNQP